MSKRKLSTADVGLLSGLGPELRAQERQARSYALAFAPDAGDIFWLAVPLRLHRCTCTLGLIAGLRLA